MYARDQREIDAFHKAVRDMNFQIGQLITRCDMEKARADRAEAEVAFLRTLLTKQTDPETVK